MPGVRCQSYMRKSSIVLSIMAGIILLLVVAIVVIPQAGMAFMNVLKTGKLGFLWEPHTVMMLDKSVELLERYRSSQDEYPIKLENVKDLLKEGEVFLNGDPMGPMIMGEKLRPLHYERLEEDKSYYLFGIGLDGKPFSEDDVYPNEEAVKNSAGFKKPDTGA